jgi:hypothetical protein
MVGSVKVEMPAGHRERLVRIARQDLDIHDMKFEDAKVDITPDKGIELTKRYRCLHVPYNRVYYWRSSKDKDHNDEMLAEIALIEENL